MTSPQGKQKTDSLHHRLDARLGACAGHHEAATLVRVMRRYGEEGAAAPLGDHPLAHVEGQIRGAVEDNVHDGLEGVRREAFSGRNLSKEEKLEFSNLRTIKLVARLRDKRSENKLF